MTTSARLWILEGPDGGGKSTLAAQLARVTGARVVHLGPFPRITRGLGRLYVEAMLPALQGLADVVLDRSWLSEPIYAEARRHAPARLNATDLRMLERVAARCRTTVVRCLPPLATCAKVWAARRGTEYLRTAEELAGVWGLYAVGPETGLPVVNFDYTAGVDELSVIQQLCIDFPRTFTTCPHALATASAGYLDASVLLVGDKFAAHKEQDTLQQYPFVSFTGDGCSRWLTTQLAEAGVIERALLWANVDQDLRALLMTAPRVKTVVALGESAADVLNDVVPADIRVVRVAHPQHVKRFKHHKRYELLDVLAEVLS